jgi:Tol biopolymer transport system component
MRYAIRTVAVSIMIIGLSSIIVMAAGATGPSISLVSVSTSGEQANVYTRDTSATPDGRYVVFSSEADNLVTPDTRSHPDIFLRDTVAGTTTRITNTSVGGPPNGGSESPVISEDGRYVAFASRATNFVGQPTTGYNAYVYDTQTGDYTLASVNTAGDAANAGGGTQVGMSPDGRYVVFATKASNLSPLDNNPSTDIYIRDLQKGVTRLVSIDVNGNAAGRSRLPQVSSDGQVIAFESGSPKLVAHDTNGVDDDFVRDRVSKTTERVSVNGAGVQANGETVFRPALSGSGRFVAFVSTADNLSNVDTPGGGLFLHDRETGATKLISKTSDGLGGNAAAPVMSVDGRFIAFNSDSVLLPEDTNGAYADVYVWDRPDQQMSLVSQPLTGTQEDSISQVRGISANGRFVYFDGSANNLVDNDTNINSDLFVLDRTG